MKRCHTRCLILSVFCTLFALSFTQNLLAQQFNFRAINLATGTDGIDIHFNNIAQASLQDVAFGDASKILPGLPAVGGQFNLKISKTGEGLGAAFVDEDVAVQGGSEYTGVAYGGEGRRKVKVLERMTNQAPLVGRVLVRVLHAVNDVTAFDIYIGSVSGDPLFSNVMMDQATKMLNVTAEATAFIVTESGKKTPLVQLTGPFGLGTPYLTLIMTGPNKNDMQVYAHAFAGNEQQDEGLVLLEEASYTNLRVVHLRPNAEVDKGDKLDIYLNRATVSDAKVADTLNYRYASRDFGPLFADSFRLKFVPPGESPSTSVLTVDQRLGNDTSYVVILTQFTDLKPTPMILTRTPVNPLPPGLGSSLIRFANAAPFHTPLTVVVTYGDDTIRFEDVAFKASTEFRSIATGQPLSIEVFRQGQEMPFFTAGSAQVSVPVGSYLTVIASGNEQGFTAQMLNESQSGLQPLTSFDPISSVAFEGVTHNYELKSVPNPASDQARLSFQLERSGRITVSLYDAMGRLLEAIPSRNFEVGEASLELNTGHLVPGMYTCVLQGDDGSVETVKIMVAR